MISIRLPFQVPYTAQIASPDLAGAIFDDGLDPTQDPRWPETGAVSPEEYAYWVDRACGIASVKMCIDALGGKPRPLMEWVRKGVANGGYLVDTDAQGQKIERGWLHQGLADLINAAGFFARPLPATIDAVVQFLAEGNLVIASVSCELGKDGPITRKGGHLVVVTGADVLENGEVIRLYIHNPSGRRKALQTYASINRERFTTAYSGRAILVSHDPIP